MPVGRQTGAVRLPQYRSPFARAVMPVLGGLLVFVAIGAFTWAIAAYISRGDVDTSERFARTSFPVGPVDALAEAVAEDGPLFFPELGTVIGTRSIVVDHEGTSPADGWRVYWAFPADRDASCVVEQVVGTSQFVDCEGRTIEVTELSPPDDGVFPTVQDRTTLVIDLRGLSR